MSIWGPQDLAVGQAGRWTIGGASLWIKREPSLLVVGTAPALDHNVSDVRLELPLNEAAPPEGLVVRRYAVEPGTTMVRVDPIHADRPVVVRTDSSLFIPSGTSIVAYVSAPLWVRLGLGAMSTDAPLLRPSDTWFGGPTASDGLAYASRTSLRTKLQDVPERVHRVVVTVRIINGGEDTLELSRMRLPVGRLQLFEAASGGLWSNLVEFERSSRGDDAHVTIQPGPPPDRMNARLIAEPRLSTEYNPVQRAFDALLR